MQRPTQLKPAFRAAATFFALITTGIWVVGGVTAGCQKAVNSRPETRPIADTGPIAASPDSQDASPDAAIGSHESQPEPHAAWNQASADVEPDPTPTIEPAPGADSEPPPTLVLSDESAMRLRTLLDLSAAPDARQSAASALVVSSSTVPACTAVVRSLLAFRPEPTGGAAEPSVPVTTHASSDRRHPLIAAATADCRSSALSHTLRAIAAMPVAPAYLLEPVAQIASSGYTASRSADPSTLGPRAEAPVELRLEALRALSSIRTRASARALFDLSAQPDPIGGSALSALARLSGRSDLGMDRSRWEQWLGGLEWVTEAQWRLALVEGLAERSDVLTARTDAAMAKLLDVLTRRYAATEVPADRSAQLSLLLADELPAVKRLGFSLAMSELANARPLEPIVGEAALRCLTDPLPDVRVAAADLLRLIATPEQARQIASALISETDPPAASKLLSCVARFPSADLIQPALRWLAHGPVTEGAAIDALSRMQRDGLIETGELSERVAEVLARIDPGSPGLSPAQVENRRLLLEALSH